MMLELCHQHHYHQHHHHHHHQQQQQQQQFDIFSSTGTRNLSLFSRQNNFPVGEKPPSLCRYLTKLLLCDSVTFCGQPLFNISR